MFGGRSLDLFQTRRYTLTGHVISARAMNNIPGFISRSGVNWALFTPSFIEALEPKNVPVLRTLVLVEEPISVERRDAWASQTQLLYGYGQRRELNCVQRGSSPFRHRRPEQYRPRRGRPPLNH